MKSKLITSLIVGIVLWLSFARGTRAQTPTIEVTPTDTPVIQIHLEIEPVIFPSELLEPTLTPTLAPTATTKQLVGTTDEGINTFFWALAIISGASILWLIGVLLGPTKKKEKADSLDEH